MSESANGGGVTRWAASGMSMLPGLSPRPQHHITNKSNIKEHVKSTSNATFVFAKDCTDIDVEVEGKVGKVTLEKCKDVRVCIDNRVVGGTLEVIKCQKVSIRMGKDAEVPIITVDDSADVNIHIMRKSQLQSVYFIRTAGVYMNLENQTTDENPEEGSTLSFHIDQYCPNAEKQQVAHWDSISNSSNFVTENVVRDGIYPSTAQMKQVAEAREEKAMKKMMEMVADSITIKPASPQEGENKTGQMTDEDFKKMD